jgi:hypothetical protein
LAREIAPFDDRFGSGHARDYLLALYHDTISCRSVSAIGRRAASHIG